MLGQALIRFVRLTPMVSVGGKLHRAVDLLTVVAMAILTQTSPDVVAKDLRMRFGTTVRKLEEQANGACSTPRRMEV